MTQDATNLLPFTAPLNYDASTWEIARRYILAGNVTNMSDLMILSAVGEGKTDTNNKGPVSTDCIGCRCARVLHAPLPWWVAALVGCCLGGFGLCERATRRARSA